MGEAMSTLFGGSTPKAPPPPPPPPARSDLDIQAERSKQAALVRQRRGRASQILAGEQRMTAPVTTANTGSETLGA